MKLRLPRIYCDAPLPVGATLQLPDDAARHVQVLRLQPGNDICLFNGQGGSHMARILNMGKHTVDAQVLSHDAHEHEASCHTHIALGMPANERMDWLVEKATELGVAHITPLSTQHTVLRLTGERALKRQQHWRGIAQAACAQTGRNRVPLIDVPQTFGDWLKSLPDTASHPRVLLSFQDGAQAWRNLWSQPPPTLTLLSGPEGGLSLDEEALAIRKGFVPVHLGNRVLRAETAPLAVLAQLL